MLEQAVIDATELKEAAIKNAEQTILEKYSNEIKEAVDTLLEQPEDEIGFEEEEIEGEPIDIPDEIAGEVPLAALDGEKACPCPEEDDMVELDLKQLQAVMAEEVPEEEEFEIPMGEEQPIMYETSQSDLENLLETDKGQFKKKGKGKPKLAYEKGKRVFEEENDEEIELDEESLKDAIEEILKVDIENVARGDLGSSHPTKPQEKYALAVEVAGEQDTETAEENKELRKALKKLEEQIKSLKLNENKLSKDYNNLKGIALDVSKKLEEVNFSNAKLIYTNNVLKSHSLNERQKDKLVEAISNSNSIEEAKVIFDTLKESLSTKENSSPKTLSEAVNKNNHLILKSNKEKQQVLNPQVDRMKKLAGII
jgi:hypothetical protein